jgi:hypothetical protein
MNSEEVVVSSLRSIIKTLAIKDEHLVNALRTHNEICSEPFCRSSATVLVLRPAGEEILRTCVQKWRIVNRSM